MKIGIIESGQLARMLALAGIPLGHTFRFFSKSRGSPCDTLGEIIIGDLNDPKTFTAFTSGLDLVTYEFENLDPELLRKISNVAPMFPSIEAL